jgi:hypothetical protein
VGILQRQQGSFLRGGQPVTFAASQYRVDARRARPLSPAARAGPGDLLFHAARLSSVRQRARPTTGRSGRAGPPMIGQRNCYGQLSLFRGADHRPGMTDRTFLSDARSQHRFDLHLRGRGLRSICGQYGGSRNLEASLRRVAALKIETLVAGHGTVDHGVEPVRDWILWPRARRAT